MATPPPQPPVAAGLPTDSRGKISEATSGGGRGIRRQVDWSAIAREAMDQGDTIAAQSICQAFPIQFIHTPDGNMDGAHHPMSWKLLAQLRATVNESGLHGEPTNQMINYIWGSTILAPEDLKVIMRMIMTQSEQLLWQAHWQRLCEISSNTPRYEGDPLFGVTVQQLMGTGLFTRPDMQVQLGPEICLESMNLARRALGMIRTSKPTPSYMSLKQGRDETFASFIDKVMDAISKADVPDWMKPALLRQCAMENCNAATRAILVTLPMDASVEAMLERMSRVPVGPHALLVDAMKDLGLQLAESHTQAFAALTPLLSRVGREKGEKGDKGVVPRHALRCFRCGKAGHMRRDCKARVWCQNCSSATHDTAICRMSGNAGTSANSRRATTTIAAPVREAASVQRVTPPNAQKDPQQPSSDQQPEEASAWTWKPP